MANVRNANTYYVDATGSLAIKGIRLVSAIFTSSNTNAVMTLKDVTTAATKLTVRIAATNTTQAMIFTDDTVIVFPNGIDVTAVTDMVATLVVEEVRG